MRIKLVSTIAAIAVSATMVSAHLPSANDARFQIDRERMRMSEENRLRNVTYTFRNTWNRDAQYNGDYANFRGDTVQWGEYNGRPLFWWAKFWSKGDEPGTLGVGGGTSPWVMINSVSASASSRGTPSNPVQSWRGFGPNGSINSGEARVATWRNGAQGAYSFTHDDIGPMPFDKAIKPAFDLAREPGFEEIKMGWGVFVGRMSDDDWNNALVMVRDGHEMFNHSYDHTSAADQYQWFYNKQVIPDFDPSIPYAIRGLTVRSLWYPNPGSAPAPWDNPGPTGLVVGNPTTHNCDPAWPNSPNRILTLSDAGIRIEGPAYWMGLAFSTDVCQRNLFTGTPVMQGGNGLGQLRITPLGNTRAITLPSGMIVYVNYTSQADLTGLPEDGSATDVRNEGVLYATTPAWLDPRQIDEQGENGWSSNTVYAAGGGVRADQGVPGLIASIFTVKAWEGPEFTRNMRDANNRINERIYNRIVNPGKHFARGKRSEYYGYPFDAYSLATHGRLEQYGIFQARGGSKTPVPMLHDFFHPYAIDFDAFWIDRTDWTPGSGSSILDSRGDPIFTYPGNAHVWLGLNEMVDKIVASRGYMIREFHSVGDIADNAWFLDAQGRPNQPSNMWALNSPAAQQGGWWGGITKNQLRQHYNYIRPMIEDGRLVVFTPSEAVKYRLTANATSNPQLTLGTTHTLRVTANAAQVRAEQRDEISVIVGIPATQNLNVEYVGGANGVTNPRLAPRRLNSAGTAWAINFNPFVSNEVRLIPGQNFVDPIWDCPGCPTDIGGSDCDPFTDPNCQVAISNVAQRTTSYAFTGIQNGRINLRLSAGSYTAELYNLQGRIVGRTDINAVNGVNATNLRTDNLAKGMFILRVKDARGASVLQHKIMLK